MGVTMKIIIKDKDGEPAYMVEEHTGRYPCFELFTWKPERTGDRGQQMGKVLSAGFVSQGRYPSTLSHALRMVAECILRESPECFEVDTTQEGMDALAGKVDYLLDSFQAEILDDTEQAA
jgi:hypothetical protein